MQLSPCGLDGHLPILVKAALCIPRVLHLSGSSVPKVPCCGRSGWRSGVAKYAAMAFGLVCRASRDCLYRRFPAHAVKCRGARFVRLMRKQLNAARQFTTTRKIPCLIRASLPASRKSQHAVANMSPMRNDRLHSVLVLVLCWAQLAGMLTSAGLAQACIDASGSAHVEFIDSSCRLSVSTARDRASSSTHHAETCADRECGSCTHIPLFDARALVRATSPRLDLSLPDVLPIPEQPCIDAGISCRPKCTLNRSMLPHGPPPDVAATLCAVILTL